MILDWKSQMWWNTATNYLRTIGRVFSGLIIFRLLYQHFSTEQFGFWALLWSLFGYTILLDFGLGLTAQRDVARCTATGEWDKLSRQLSTVVWTFLGFGLIIAVTFFLFKPVFLGLIGISSENAASFGRAYWIFFGAMAVAFPLGLFPEMVVGLQRIDLVNWTILAGTLVNLALVVVGVRLEWSLEAFVLIGVATTVIPNVVLYFIARRLMPRLSLSLKQFDLASVRSVLAFSVTAYVITLTSIIISRTDQVVISVCLGVALVTVYQVGYKISEVYGWFTHQLNWALSPVAAHLTAKGDESGLRELVVKSTRATILLAMIGYGFSAAYLDPMIRVITGLKQVEWTTHLVGQILLLSTWTTLITSSGVKRILIMAGYEKSLLKISVTEALANLVLSVVLAFKYGVIGVALGTLIPAVLIGWGLLVPLTLRFSKLTAWEWVDQVFRPIFTPVAYSLGVLVILMWLWPAGGGGSILGFISRGVIVVFPAAMYCYLKRREMF